MAAVDVQRFAASVFSNATGCSVAAQVAGRPRDSRAPLAAVALTAVRPNPAACDPRDEEFRLAVALLPLRLDKLHACTPHMSYGIVPSWRAYARSLSGAAVLGYGATGFFRAHCTRHRHVCPLGLPAHATFRGPGELGASKAKGLRATASTYIFRKRLRVGCYWRRRLKLTQDIMSYLAWYGSSVSTALKPAASVLATMQVTGRRRQS